MSTDVDSRPREKKANLWARLSGTFATRPLDEDDDQPHSADAPSASSAEDTGRKQRGSGGEGRGGRGGLLGSARSRTNDGSSQGDDAAGSESDDSSPKQRRSFGRRKDRGSGSDSGGSHPSSPLASPSTVKRRSKGKSDTAESNADLITTSSGNISVSGATTTTSTTSTNNSGGAGDSGEPAAAKPVTTWVTSPRGPRSPIASPRSPDEISSQRPSRGWAAGTAHPREDTSPRSNNKYLSVRRGKAFFGFGSKPEEVLSTSPPSSPPPVPFVVDEGRVAIVVECLDQKFQRTIRTDEDATLNDILAQLVKKNPFPDVNDYAFFLKENKTRGPLSKLEPLKNFAFEPMTVLQLIRTQVVLKVEWEGTTFNIATQPESSVKQTLQQIHTIIRKKTTLEKPNEYCLFFPMEKGGEIMLEEKRTIASYRLNSHTLLHFKKISKSITATQKSTQRLDKLLAAEKEAGDDKVYLIIESPTHGIKKTFQFSSDTQVMEAMRQFNRYCKATNTSAYHLVIPPATSNDDEVVLDNMQRLSHYNFGHLTRVHFKEKVSPSAPPRMSTLMSGLGGTLRRRTVLTASQEKAITKNQQQPFSVFRIDPSILPHVEDNGFQVPAFLAQMRKSLYEKNALEQEGLFRLAGDELEMNLIKKQVSDGSYTDCIDVNAVATLIKRWFGELPVRVFAAMPKGEYERCVGDEAACATFPDRLAEPHRTLFLWFAAILIDVAKRQHINKMGPGNLAVVVAPILAHIPDGNPIEGLIITGHVVNIITVYLQHRLKSEA